MSHNHYQCHKNLHRNLRHCNNSNFNSNNFSYKYSNKFFNNSNYSYKYNRDNDRNRITLKKVKMASCLFYLLK